MAKRGRPRAEISYEQIQEEVLVNKLSFRQIAEKYGTSDDTIRRRVKEGPARKANKQSVGTKKSANTVPPSDLKAAAQSNLEQQVTEASDSDSDEIKTTIKGRQWLLSKVVGNDPRDRYFYNRDTDSYITFLKRAPEPIVVSGADHRAICQAYSDWDGNPSSLNQICRQFSFPRPWLVEYLRIHGITHDKEPFSAEEVMERDTPDLVEDMYQMRRQALHQQFEERKWQDTKKAALKWEQFEHSVVHVIDDWASRFANTYRPSLMSIPPQAGNGSYAALVLPMDLHYGKAGWMDEVGDSYTRRQVRDLLLTHTEKLGNRLVRIGRPAEMIVPIGSDWFHIDNPQGTTTHGTPQDMDGTPGVIMTEAMELKVEFIDMLRQIAPVTLIACPGNHDYQNSQALMMYLLAWYRNNSDVHVIKSLRPRNYYQYQNTLIGMTHGNDVKVRDLPALMASEERKLWGETEHQIYCTGHLHSEKMADVNGLVHYQCPSLSGADRWHDAKGYVLSRAALGAVVVDNQDGPTEFISTIVSNTKTIGFNLKNRSRQ